jgi:hypothetical protein
VNKSDRGDRNPLSSEEWATLRASIQQSRADDSKRRWGRGRNSEPEEKAVNLWVAQQLISDAEWLAMQQAHPGDLKRIAEQLELPVAAVIWRARADQGLSGQGVVTLSSEALALLQKPAVGTGGIQSLLRKLQSNLQANQLLLTRKEFGRIREYLVNLGGGGRARLEAVMKCSLEAMASCGGLEAFFAGQAALPPAPKKSAIEWKIPVRK